MINLRKVILIQRRIPHFRVPVLNELARRSPERWLCLSGRNKVAPELRAKDSFHMKHEEVRVRNMGRYCFITGVHVLRRKPDAVLLESSLNILSNIPFMLWCRLWGIPVILWAKGMRQNRMKRTGLNRLYEKFVYALAYRFVAYGKCSARDLIAKGIPQSRIFIAQNSIDTDAILAHRKKASTPGTEDRQGCVFGYMGRLFADKDVVFIVNAFAAYRARFANRLHDRLIISGDGPDRQRISEHITKHRLEEFVIMPGAVPVGKEEQFFDHIDVYLSVKSHGLGIIEAMAYSKAVLITPEDGPESENIVHGETGIIASDNSIDAFAEAMASLGTNKELRAKLGHASITHVQTSLGISQMADGIENAIASITKH